MKLWKKMIVIGCLLALMVPAIGCEKEGPAEKAGKQIDEMVDDAKDSAKKIFD